MIQHKNITEHDHCPICLDEGIVELAGTVRVNGVTYSRGSALCKWCEEGARRYVRAVSPPRKQDDHHRKWRPCEDFTLEDVITPNTDKPLPRDEARKRIASLRLSFDKP